MLSSWRLSVGALLVTCVATVLVAMVVSSREGTPAIDASEIGNVWRVADGLLHVPGIESLSGGQQAEQQSAATRANPQAVAERGRSRTAYQGIGAAAAARVDESADPAVAAPAPIGLGHLPEGVRLTGYLAGNAARVTLPNGRRAVMDSATPIAVWDGHGYQAVNLGLRAIGGQYAPVETDAPVRIPSSLGAGAELDSSGVSLTPVDSAGSPLRAEGSLQGSSVFYANTERDSDTAIKATASGFELYGLLRSVQSPEQLEYRIGLPAGAQVVAVAGGAGGARVVLGGRTIARIPAVTAIDADGTPVPVSTSLSGHTLDVKVAHRSGDFRYPITVDPAAVDTSLTSISPDWHYENTFGGGGGHFGWSDNYSAGWEIYDDYAHKAEEWAALIYPTQGESHVYALGTELAVSQAGSNVETYVEIASSAGWEALEAVPEVYSRGIKDICVAAGCATTGGTRENIAALWLAAVGTGNGGTDYLYNASVYVAQENGPSVVADTTDEKVGFEKGYANVLHGGGGWLGPANETAAEFDTTDPGVGVDEVSYTLSNGKKWSSKPGCAGIQCPETVNQPLYYKASGASALPDGEPTLEVKPLDAMGSSAVTSVKLKVDGTAPTELSLSGLPGSGEVSDASRALKIVVKAKDGLGTTVSSGIASLALAVDKVPVGSPAGSCSPGPCTATAEWNVNTGEYAAGKHVFTVTATDAAGNVATSETPFTVHHATPQSLGPGSFNPVTGEFDVEETDVSMPTTGAPLEITRAYDSREPSGGSEGPLGGPWSISFGGSQMIEETLTGAELLTDADGRQTVFESTGGGHYQPPAADRTLALTKSGSEFKLTDDGSTTTFAQVAGDRGNVWRPTVSKGIGGSNQTVFSYQVVEGVLEPLQELGPVPAGVTCATELKAGCRALTFNYAASTTATGEGPSEWGDYAGHLTRVYFTAVEPGTETMVKSTVAQYAYDSKGRLRAEWDPRISPALKKTYGYDPEGHLTSIAAPGGEPWIFTYGTTSGDTTPGRVVAVGRPTPSTSLGNGIAPVSTSRPTMSSYRPMVSTTISVKAGAWSNAPLRYAYQWERCNYAGGSCAPIGGAINREYTPTESDRGRTLRVRIGAINAGGATNATTPLSSVVVATNASIPQPVSEFGSTGAGNGQFKTAGGVARDSSGDVWVADTGNNRIEEFNPEGKFLRVAGTSGSGQLSNPEDVAVEIATSDVWVADTGKSRVVEFNSSGEYMRSFGTEGTGNGQFKSPGSIASSNSDDVWVTDTGNNRVQEFTFSGTYMKSIGSAGTGNGQFTKPGEVAVDSKHDVWVTDTGNNRVQEFTEAGVFIRAFGSSGSGNGQFCSPSRLVADLGAEHVWVADSCNNRLQEFTSEGVFMQSYGTSGTGEGQFKGPHGIAFSRTGYMDVLDSENGRIQEFADGDVQAITSFGTPGTGEGQLQSPWGLARDPVSGNLWVADNGNNRIEELDPEGKYVRTAGTSGSGALSSPEDVAVDSSGNVWVDDMGKSRVVEFNGSGEFLRAFGTAGTETGQLKSPAGIALDSAGHVWVADTGNNRVQEFSGEGSYMKTVGSVGTGNGQLEAPGGLTIDGKGNLWVADTDNERVEEFNGEGAYVQQFGTYGPEDGHLVSPLRLVVDANEHVWVSESGNLRVQEFTTSGSFIETFGSSGAGLGQFKRSPSEVVLAPNGDIYVADRNNNRIQVWGGSSYWEGKPSSSGEETSLPVSATSTIEYSVPISGSGAPYAMSSSEVGKWAQTDIPAEATAIFAPDEQVGWPAPDYRRATISYFDSADRVVNVVAPGGGTSTTEYNSYNDVVRKLTPDNRAAALKEGAKSAEVAQTLDTQSTYNSEGTEMLSTLGPKHAVKLASGSEAQAREHTVYSYDEGAPAGGPYRLVTKVTKGAQITGESEADVRTTTTSYAGQNNLGWILRKPTATRTDPSGLKLTHSTVYDPETGNVVETRTPGAGSPGEEILSGYIHRSGFGNSGLGELSKPGGVALDGEGNVWVADTGHSKVEEYSSGGTFIQKFGGAGSFNGDMTSPEGIAIDGKGDVWVADTGNNRIEEFSSTGAYMFKVGASGTGWEQFKSPTGIAFSSVGTGRLFVTDTGNNRIAEYELTSEMKSAKMLAEFGTSGTGNGQFSKPEGLAVESAGNVWVADTGNNRVQEVTAEGAKMHYDRQFGSLGSGNGQLSKPEGVALDSEGNVLVADSGNSRVQSFTSAGVYSFQFGSVGTGELNFKTSADLALNAQNEAYVIDTGNSRVEKWAPAALVHESSGTGGTHGTQTVYYTTGENTRVGRCGWKPAWAGLPCQTSPAAQPETSGLPHLPVTTVEYNIWDEPTKSAAEIESSSRITSNTYDAAGRLLTQAVTSSIGTLLPTTKDEYNSETGNIVKVSTTLEGTTRSIEGSFNRYGELVSYKDADGNTSITTYDPYGRPEVFNDGKGTQEYSYNSTTGLESRLIDSAAGVFYGTYDTEGNLTSISYPNGMNVSTTYDATGRATHLEYVKTTHCTSGCTWYSDSVVPSIHGQILSQSSTFSSQAYTFDAAGRLTKVQDTPSGVGCTTRIYAYDEETNITSLTTRAPGVGGVCASEGGTAENHSFDSANRLTDAGISYDTFGDITKLPASDAGGSEVTSSFYADSTLASQSQKGETIGYYLDPAGRQRLTVSSGNVNSTVTSHYAGEGSNPAWTEDTAGNWTRNISGIDGGLAAVQTNGAAPVLQVENLHGDIVGTVSLSETATGLLSSQEQTEYGVPRSSTPAKYSWLGGLQLSTELPSGVIAMGARSYVPQIGRFLQPDPIQGGSANAYSYTYGDPVDTSDPSGEFTVGIPSWVHEFFTIETEVATEAAIQRAAEEQAEREEAEEKAREAAEEAAAAAAEEAAEAAESPSGGGGGGGKKGKKGKKGGGKKGGKPGGSVHATATVSKVFGGTGHGPPQCLDLFKFGGPVLGLPGCAGREHMAHTQLEEEFIHERPAFEELLKEGMTVIKSMNEAAKAAGISPKELGSMFAEFATAFGF